MNTNRFSTQIRKTLYGIMLLGMFVASFGAGNLPTARAQEVANTPTVNAVNLNFYSTVDLPPGADIAIVDEFSSDGSVANDTDIYVVSLDKYDDWAIGTILIGSNIISNGAMPENSILVILHSLGNGSWDVALSSNTQEFEYLLTAFPTYAIPEKNKQFLLPKSNGISIERIPTSLKFPWQSGQTWVMTTGIHGTNNSSLDFAPYSSSDPAQRYVVAAASGVVIRYCTGQNQAWVMVRHSSGGSTDYWTGYLHLDKNTVSLNTGASVSQGSILGRTYNSSGTEPCSPYTWTVSSSGPHVHFSVGTIPAGSNDGGQVTSVAIAGTIISGWTVQSNGCLTKDGVTKCVGDSFTSDNGGGGQPVIR